MKRLEVGVPGLEISIPVPDDIESNKAAQKAFIEENRDELMLFGLMGAIFGTPTMKVHDCSREDSE